jgi:hypothetical protein
MPLEAGLPERLLRDADTAEVASERATARPTFQKARPAPGLGFFAFGGARLQKAGHVVPVCVLRQAAEGIAVQLQEDAALLGALHLFHRHLYQVRRTETGFREVGAGVDYDVRDFVVTGVDHDGVKVAHLPVVGGEDCCAVAEVIDKRHASGPCTEACASGRRPSALARILAPETADELRLQLQALLQRHAQPRRAALTERTTSGPHSRILPAISFAVAMSWSAGTTRRRGRTGGRSARRSGHL